VVENPSFPRPLRNRQRIVGIPDTAADDRVHRDVEGRRLGERHQLLIQDFQALLRHLVGHHIVDADLKVIEPGLIQSLDAIARQKIPVGDERGDRAAAPDVANDLVEIGMQQRLASAQRHDTGPEIDQAIDPAQHVHGRNRRRAIVVLVAIRARKIAATDRDEMCRDRPVAEAE
jgi:hypothetical protein